MPLGFLIAILAALGFRQLASSPAHDAHDENGIPGGHTRYDRHAFAIICGTIAAILVWLYVRTETLDTLTSQEKHIRLGSLEWSLGSLVLGSLFLLGWLYLFRYREQQGNPEENPAREDIDTRDVRNVLGELPAWSISGTLRGPADRGSGKASRSSRQAAQGGGGQQNSKAKRVWRRREIGSQALWREPGLVWIAWTTTPTQRCDGWGAESPDALSAGPLKSRLETIWSWNSALWPVLVLLAILASQAILLLPPAATATSYSHRFFPGDPMIRAVQATVGDHLMGDGPPPSGNTSPSTVPGRANAFTPETNMPYKIAFFGAYDAMLQAKYISSWNAEAKPHTPVPLPPGGNFIPSFNNAALARLYGIRYLLTVRSSQGNTEAPYGTYRVLVEPSFTIYEVPDAHRFTLVSSDLKDVVHIAEQGSAIYGKVTSWRWVSDNHLTITAASSSPSELLARVADVPGWHASVNGHAVPVKRAAGIMLAIPLPAGKSTIDLTYWPAAFTAGIIVAILAMVIILALAVISIQAYRVKLRHASARSA